MKNYYVQWEIDVYAASPEEAVREAWRYLRKPDSTANVFDVWDNGEKTQIDLTELDEAAWLDEDTSRRLAVPAFLDEPVLTRPQPVDSPLRRDVPLGYEDTPSPWPPLLLGLAIFLTMLTIAWAFWCLTSGPTPE